MRSYRYKNPHYIDRMVWWLHHPDDRNPYIRKDCLYIVTRSRLKLFWYLSQYAQPFLILIILHQLASHVYAVYEFLWMIISNHFDDAVCLQSSTHILTRHHIAEMCWIIFGPCVFWKACSLHEGMGPRYLQPLRNISWLSVTTALFRENYLSPLDNRQTKHYFETISIA